MGYDYDYIYKPATPGQVLELLREIEADEARIERIEEFYTSAGLDSTRDDEYQRIANRIQSAFSLAESYWQEIQARDDHDDGELKPWTNKQMDLAGSWDWK